MGRWWGIWRWIFLLESFPTQLRGCISWGALIQPSIYNTRILAFVALVSFGLFECPESRLVKHCTSAGLLCERCSHLEDMVAKLCVEGQIKTLDSVALMQPYRCESRLHNHGSMARSPGHQAQGCSWM